MKPLTLALLGAVALAGVAANVPDQGIRTITLSSSNTVSLSTAINGETAARLQAQLIEADRTAGFFSPVYLTLNSPGGSVTDGEKVIETVNGLGHRVDTISMFSASMSFIISQYLGKRYVLESGTMMSHRAYAEGLSGQVPGNLITRALELLTSVTKLDEHIAARVGMKLKDYQAFIHDEAWMRGEEAVKLKFADSLVRVKCDPSLQGTTAPQTIQLLFTSVKVKWYKCPLITQPAAVDVDESASNSVRKEILTLLYAPSDYVRQYGVTKLSGGL